MQEVLKDGQLVHGRVKGGSFGRKEAEPTFAPADWAGLEGQDVGTKLHGLAEVAQSATVRAERGY